MDFWLGEAATSGPGVTERMDALFGGTGEVRVVDLLGASSAPAPFAAALACELAPGASVGAHVQAEYAEVVIFVEGRARVTA